MSSYPPPSKLPATFNASNWIFSTPTTQQQNDTRYLKLTGGTETGLVNFNAGVNVLAGNSYQIGGTSVLNSSTLGSGILNSSLKSLGILNSLSLSSSMITTLSVTTSINPGTPLTLTVPTGYTMNLGGIRLLWGTVGCQVTQSAISIAGWGRLTWGSGYLNTIQTIVWGTSNLAGNPYFSVTGNSAGTTDCSFYVVSTTTGFVSGNSGAVCFLIIGT